jgi:hypothetical protein
MERARIILALPGALWQLARLGIITGLRFRGPYWTWRWKTAFGEGTPPRAEKFRAAIEYGRWVAKMRNL